MRQAVHEIVKQRVLEKVAQRCRCFTATTQDRTTPYLPCFGLIRKVQQPADTSIIACLCSSPRCPQWEVRLRRKGEAALVPLSKMTEKAALLEERGRCIEWSSSHLHCLGRRVGKANNALYCDIAWSRIAECCVSPVSVTLAPKLCGPFGSQWTVFRRPPVCLHGFLGPITNAGIPGQAMGIGHPRHHLLHP